MLALGSELWGGDAPNSDEADELGEGEREGDLDGDGEGDGDACCLLPCFELANDDEPD